MNPKYEIHEWIDRYLNGEMNESEIVEFETELRSDSNLSNTLLAQKVANKIVIGEELLQLKKQMAEDLSGGANIGSTGTWKYLVSGVVIITAAVVIYFFMKDRQALESKELIITKAAKNKESDLGNNSVNNALQILEDKFDTTNASESNSNKQEDTAVAIHKNQDKNIKTNICSDSLINFSCQAKGTCIQKNDGVIEIDINTIKSVHAPIWFSVNPEIDFRKEPIISNLKPGVYTLYVKDAKQCLHELNTKIEVQEINCGNNLILK